MDMEDKLDIILTKVRKVKKLRFLNIFLASVLTMVGTISIISLLMFLNASFGMNYFMCLIMTFILSNAYSVMANESLDGLGNKIRVMLLEIKKLEEEYEKDEKAEQIIKSIELRFDGLSKDSKLKLLNYIKEKVSSADSSKNINLFTQEDIEKMIEEFDSVQLIDLTTDCLSGYTRKRNKNI